MPDRNAIKLCRLNIIPCFFTNCNILKYFLPTPHYLLTFYASGYIIMLTAPKGHEKERGRESAKTVGGAFLRYLRRKLLASSAKATGTEPAPLHAGPFRRFSPRCRRLASARLPSPRRKSLENCSAWSAKQFLASGFVSGQGKARGEYFRIAKGFDAARAQIRRQKPARVQFPSP